MELTEILESNKLIAEFMGVMKHEECFGFPFEDNVMKLQHVGEYSTHSFIDEEDNIFYLLTLGELKYNCSFEWLMPVVEKIQNDSILSFTIEMDAVRAICFDSEIKSYRNGELVGFRSLINNHFKLITCIYHVVIETIHWYNTKNQQRETQ